MELSICLKLLYVFLVTHPFIASSYFVDDSAKVINDIFFATVDRFSPRFLAEEPFFIVDSSSAASLVPFPSIPSAEGTESVVPLVNPEQTSSFSAPSSTLTKSGASYKRSDGKKGKHAK